MSVNIHIKNAKKQYDKNVVIKSLTTDILPGELFTLLGPSGCGKTTLLRMIAGFNSVDGGTIAFEDKVINDIPVYKRNFGMVFQNYAIFPNMTVYRNIEYGLKNKKLPKEEIKARVEEIMKTVQIDIYKDRYPDKLSGGQQQRVALARAIVVRPEVLLMDEPLSNLDAKLRVEMREAIRDIQKKIGITTVYVTHDQEEALAISDRIAVMDKGDIQQVEKPERLYLRPYNVFVASFIGHSTPFAATVVEQTEDGTTTLQMEQGHTVHLKGVNPVEKGQEVLLLVRPEEFIFVEDGSKKGLKGTVTIKRFLGKYINYFIDFGMGEPVEVSADLNSTKHIYEPGDEVYLDVNVNRVNVFNKQTTETLMTGVYSNVL